MSYGINVIPIDFRTLNASYSINISQEDVNNDVFDWIIVEPLYIKSGTINVNLTNTTDISFYAGSMVSILIDSDLLLFALQNS